MTVAWLGLWSAFIVAEAGAVIPDGHNGMVAYVGARIHPVVGEEIADGTLLVADGKIVDIGPADKIKPPPAAKVVELKGLTIIPGLVDTHSHLGLFSRPTVSSNSDGNEATGPVQTGLRALDAVNPFDPGIRMATAGGITTANIMPGSANVIGGQTVYVKLLGQTVEEMRVTASDGVLGGLKMANGENPLRVYGGKNQAPGTRMKITALQRGELLKARAYARKWDAYRAKLASDKDATPPDVQLELEPLVEVLRRQRTVHFHSHRADDIRTTIRLAEEFGFELVVQHGTEAYRIVDELARRKIPVSMTIVDSPGGKAEVVHFIEECGAQLARAGVPVIVNTDDPVTESRFFLRTAAITVRGGLSPRQALEALTIVPARAMHLDQRVGSLERGKDADFVVLSGAPFSIYSRVLETFINGQKVFALADNRQRLYQQGGFAVADPGRVPDAKPRVQPEVIGKTPTAPGSKTPRASDKEWVIHAGTVFPVAGPPIHQGAIHIKDGKILFIGPLGQMPARPDLPVLTAAAVTPGLIDPMTVVPLSGQYNIPADQDADERSDPIQADLRVVDAFNPHEPLLRFLLEQGVTIAHVCPGRSNVIAGQTGVFRTHGNTAEEMTVRFPQAMLINLGDEVKETYQGRRPRTRMATAALVRSALTEAAAYIRKQRAAKDEDSQPERQPRHDALGLLLERKIPAFVAAHRADDLLTALRIIDEYKLRGTLALATEGYLIREILRSRPAGAKVPVVVHPTMQRVGSLETLHGFLGNAAALADEGILTTIGSGIESYVPKSRVIRHEAGMAMVHGLGFSRALRAITLDAARTLEMDDRYGSIEVGKVADLVLYDGDPFEHSTHVTHVIMDGRVVHDRSEQQKIPFARRAALGVPDPACCLGW